MWFFLTGLQNPESAEPLSTPTSLPLLHPSLIIHLNFPWNPSLHTSSHQSHISLDPDDENSISLIPYHKSCLYANICSHSKQLGCPIVICTMVSGPAFSISINGVTRLTTCVGPVHLVNIPMDFWLSPGFIYLLSQPGIINICLNTSH